MPSTITHAYIAKDVYKTLDKKIKNKFNKNDLENYKTYSEGPDIYFFYNILTLFDKNGGEIREFGSYIHRNKVNELFINLTEKVKKSKNFDEFLFLIGLTTHYITDTTIHPLVNYKENLLINKKFTSKDSHFIIETYIDNYMINKKEKINYKKFKVHEFPFNLERHESVVNLLNESFKEVFKKDNMGNLYFDSLADMKTFFRLLRYDPTGIKKFLYKILNIVAKRCFRDIRYLSYNFNLDEDLSRKFLNLNHETWYNIKMKDVKRNESFLDLYDKVVKDCKKIILSLYEYVYEDKKINLEKLFGNKSYANGLPLK